MTRANTIARIRAIRSAVSALAFVCLLLALSQSIEHQYEHAKSNDNKLKNLSQTIAFLPPNKEVKIVKK